MMTVMMMLLSQANDLVFIKNSPDYCHSNHTIGSLGDHHYDHDDGDSDGEHSTFERVIEHLRNIHKLGGSQKYDEVLRMP